MNVRKWFANLSFVSLTSFARRAGVWALAASCMIVAADAFAHSDALLVNVGGQVVVGAAEDIDGPVESFALDAGLFESILRAGFAPPTPADYEGDEPGFFGLHAVNDASDLAALGASALPAGAAVSGIQTPFTVNGNLDALFFWNGVGAVDFQPISIVQPSVTFAFQPAAFGSTGVGGDVDDHPIYQLNSWVGAPADGLYLIAPQISVAGLAASKPFYMALLVDALIEDEDDLELVEAALAGLEEGAPAALVDFGAGVAKDFAFYEEGVEWIESNLVVPEPTTGLLALIGFVAAPAVSRRAAATLGSARRAA